MTVIDPELVAFLKSPAGRQHTFLSGIRLARIEPLRDRLKRLLAKPEDGNMKYRDGNSDSELMVFTDGRWCGV